MDKCALKTYPARPMLAVRTRASRQQLPTVMGKVYGEIAGHIAAQGGEAAGAPYTAYYNMDMENLDIEIGIPVVKPIPGTETITAGEIPGGPYATRLHIGPYHEISAAYDALANWMEANGHQPTGVAYEMYLNAPADTPPKTLETEVAFPLKAD